ncbi:CpaF family protein [Bacillus piscicola]|uniref:CpaF family protein n=1 Tax=Bacillus piscicola TaxID=1632684 RepID=UPI001F093D65|nr:ATPase, T2SS/T4P/T4SS family [Bacillus piscicola]
MLSIDGFDLPSVKMSHTTKMTLEERKELALQRHERSKKRKGLQEVAYRQQQVKEEQKQQLIPEHEKEYEQQNRKNQLEKLTERIADHLTEHHSADLQGSMFDLTVRNRLYPIIEKYILDRKVIISGFNDEKELTKMLVDEIAGLGPIDEIIRQGQGAINEIWINGENPVTRNVDIFYEASGKKYKVEEPHLQFRDQEHAYKIAQKIARNGQQQWGDAKPVANVRYPDGRVNLVRGPIATGGGGPYISFRLFPKDTLQARHLIDGGSMNQDLWQFIEMSIQYGLNGLMVGPTGSGKTTLLTASLEAISEDHRILLMEDTEEMRLRHKYPEKHIITEECKFDRDQEKNFDLSRLTTNALRQKPDYMIYGEVRDKAAYDMLNGANTGHRVWCTLHSRSAARSVQRLKNMVLEHGSKMDADSIGSWIAESIDIIIFQKLYEDKVRRVKEVIELVDYKQGRPIFNTIFKFVVEGKNADGTFQGRHYRTGKLSRESAEHLIHEGAPIEVIENFMQEPELLPETSFDNIIDNYYGGDMENQLFQP